MIGLRERAQVDSALIAEADRAIASRPGGWALPSLSAVLTPITRHPAAGVLPGLARSPLSMPMGLHTIPVPAIQLASHPLRDDRRTTNPNAVVQWIQQHGMLGRWNFECLRAQPPATAAETLSTLFASNDHSIVSQKPDENELWPGFGCSHATLRPANLIRKLGPLQQPVLIIGESGTGKELAASSIHNLSLRADQPLIRLNCHAINSELLEAELFGSLKGAYTGASDDREGMIATAGKGTLVLDEIGDTDINFQSALLRLLEYGEYKPVGSTTIRKAECRIIASTNVDLAEAVRAGTFRSDLLFRLRQWRITLPPLRDRLDDIPRLVDSFIDENQNDEVWHIDDSLIPALGEYRWPGNVRELRSMVQRMLVMATTQNLRAKDFHQALEDIGSSGLTSMHAPSYASAEQSTTRQAETVEAVMESGPNRRMRSLNELFRIRKINPQRSLPFIRRVARNSHNLFKRNDQKWDHSQGGADCCRIVSLF